MLESIPFGLDFAPKIEYLRQSWWIFMWMLKSYCNVWSKTLKMI